MRVPDRRTEDPMSQPHAWRERRGGFRDQRDTDRSLLGVERYTDRSVLMAQPIAWEAPVAGGNQTVTATTLTLITGSDFRISLAGPNDGGIAAWLIDLTYTLTIDSVATIDDDVLACVLVDWLDDGIWVKPDVDRDTTHGLAQAWAITDNAEGAVTGARFTLSSRAVFKVRGGSTVGIGIGVYVGAGHSAVVNLTNTDRRPSCVGMAVPCFAL